MMTTAILLPASATRIPIVAGWERIRGRHGRDPRGTVREKAHRAFAKALLPEVASLCLVVRVAGSPWAGSTSSEPLRDYAEAE